MLYLQLADNELVLTANHCHDRLCIPCNLTRRAALIEAILCAAVDAKRPVRFVTLTLKHRDVPLTDQLDRLYNCFRILRRRPFWKTAVSGGAMFLEVKVGADGLFHPHFHILCETKWLEQVKLSEEWYKVTGDSFRCDVRPVEDLTKRAVYVTKYATKPADVSILRSQKHLDEFITAIKGRRLYQPFGNWKALLPTDADTEPYKNLKPIGSVSALASDAAKGDHVAARWWAAALRKWPALSIFSPHPTPTGSDLCPP